MAIVYRNATANLKTLIRADIDERHPYAWLTTNLPAGDAVIDLTNNEILLGIGDVTIDDGVATLTNLLDFANSATDQTPTGVQYTLWVRYSDPSTGRPTTWNSGPLEFTAADQNVATLMGVQAAPPSWRSDFTAAMELIRDDAEAARDEAVDISNIATSDDVVSTLVEGTAGAGPLTRAALSATFVRTISPLDPAYGAVGDGVADDTAALVAAIAAAPALFTTVDLRGLTYKVTDAIDVPTGVKVTNGFIHNTGVGKKTFNVTGDTVTFKRVSATGRHATATYAAGESAFFAEGTSAADPIRDLWIEECSAELFGEYGIRPKFVDGLTVKGNQVGDIGYGGILGASVLNFRILDNDVENVLAGVSSNGYGISMGRAETDSLVTDPHSAHGVIAGNRVNGVPWNGIDLHGGEDIIIDANDVFACKTSIAIGASDNASNVETWAPHGIRVTNNLCDSGVTDGSANAGIIVTGAVGAVGAPTMLATDIVVSGNRVKGHGGQADALSGGLVMRDTSGAVVTHNAFIECSPNGVVFYHDNYGMVFLGNSGVDHWSSTHSDCAFISVPSGYLTGTIAGNTHRNAGNKAAATHKNARGYSASSTTGVSVEFGPNFLEECTTPLTGTTGLKRTFRIDATFTAKALLQDGNAGAPALAFTSDTNTGLYSSGADQIAHSVGGTVRLRELTTGFLFASGQTITWGGGSGKLGGATDTLGFFGAAGSTRPTAYTQTYSTADKTLGAYTADVESAAYTGAADGEAKLVDLNALRTAYENLRTHHEDLAQFVNSIVDDFQALGLLQ